MQGVWFALGALSGSLLGCASQPEPVAVTSPRVALAPHRVVADPIGTVGDAQIGALDLQRAASGAVPADGKAHAPEEVQELVDQLVIDEMLVQEALAQGLHGDPKIRRMLATLLIRQEVYGKVSATDFAEDELRAYYDEHRADFVVPERVQARRIAIPVQGDPAAANARAAALHEELTTTLAKALAARDAGIPTVPTEVVRAFERLAKEHSAGSYARRGGDLGLVSREGKPGVEAEVIEAAFGAEPRTLLEPFEANGHVHIVLVESLRPRTERTFEQMRSSILRIMRQERFEQLRTSYLDSLRERYPAVIDQPAVEAVDLTRRLGERPPHLHTHDPNDGPAH